MNATTTLHLIGSTLVLAMLVSCDVLFGGAGTAIHASPEIAVLGATKPGATLSTTVKITNTGTAAAMVTVDPIESWISASPSVVDLPAGETAQILVTGECIDPIRESLASGSVGVSTPDRTVAIRVSLACFAADLAVIEGSAYLSAQVGGIPTTGITLANTTSGSVAFEVQNADSIDATPDADTVPGHSLAELILTSRAACTSVRRIEDVSFDVVSVGTTRVDAFEICAEAPVHAYDVDIRFFGVGFDVDSITAFLDAAATWESVITGDLEDRSGLDTAAGDCSIPGFPNEPGLDDATVDDLLIHAGLFADQPGGVVGSAGPCIVRSSASPDALLPIYGTAFFDSADVQRLQTEGRFDSVILHEIGHVIGIGTIWDNLDLIEFSGSGADCVSSPDLIDARYTGAGGIDAYETLTNSPESSVPVEEDGGPGTRCGHWDEEVFDNELMTGTLDNADDPLSILTGESLIDLGYATDTSAYDTSYNLPECSPICLAATDTDGDHATDILLFPRYTVEPDGSLQPL